jgi:hypothetical protein
MMFNKFLSSIFLATALFSFVCQLNGQNFGAVRYAELEARRVVDGVDNYVDAVFSFKHGVNGEHGKRITRNNWDVIFGNISDRDTFSVTMITDDRSRLVNLGELSWFDNFQLPAVECFVEPDKERDVPAIKGHMYLVRSCDKDSDHLSVFRVEELIPKQRVKISWVLVWDRFLGPR